MQVVNPNQFHDMSRESWDSDDSVIRKVLDSGQLFRYTDPGHPSVNVAVETEFARYFDGESTIAVSSGTAGLRLALMAVGVRPGDKVLLNAYSFIACAMAVASIGAIPKPLDLRENLGLDNDALEREIQDAAAVLLVHVQGHMVPVREVRAACDSAGIPLVEDLCQALGASSNGILAGTAGQAGVTSFQQSKQISCGEGGLIVAEAGVTNRAYQLADLGSVRAANGLPDWDHEAAVIADNLRMTEIQAAIVLDQARELGKTLSQQREHRTLLWDLLRSARVSPVMSEDPDGDTGTHTLLYTRSTEDSGRFCDALAASGVLARTVWKKPFCEFGVFQRSGLIGPHSCERASRDAARIVSVPTPKYLNADEVANIAEAIVTHRSFLSEREVPGHV